VEGSALRTRQVLGGLAALTATFFIVLYSFWGGSLGHGPFGLAVPPSLVGGALLIRLLVLFDRHKPASFGARFRECSVVVTLGVVPAIFLATGALGIGPDSTVSRSSNPSGAVVAAGAIGLLLSTLAALRIAEASVRLAPCRTHWWLAVAACVACASIAATGAWRARQSETFLRSLRMVGELPAVPWAPYVPSEARETTALGGLRLTRGSACALYVEAPNQCSQLVPFSRNASGNCGAVQVHRGSTGWWLDVEGNEPKVVSQFGAVSTISRFSPVRVGLWVRVAGAFSGLLIAGWSIWSTRPARRRARQAAEGIEASHRGSGWMTPVGDRPPIHLPEAAQHERGPVVLTGAPERPETYRDGAQASGSVMHFQGTQAEVIGAARDEERGALMFAFAALCFLTLPLVAALFF
jgi:hypothetical protein